ncbi:DUF4294 domain-containing protein [Anaerophaga thermohalophila]|jgi:hypothetical protein|uniref:DUF4294 domain-containing protein n=1 Tax=Anaerophaga thermohalophila TaxID=177400 RepID=UPI000308A4BF|nr:DUF4294 domain-containing protein [Anaerophaga thermohalophila]
MSVLRQIILGGLIVVFSVSGLVAQNVKKANMAGQEVYMLESKVEGTDTIPHIMLSEVKIVPEWRFRSKRERRVYNRLVKNIKVTLPYARVAARKLEVINAELAHIEGDKARKEYLKEAEKRLFNEFEQPLRKLTFSQGRMLIKLIDRETGETSYNLIKEYKGGFSAFFWQSVARLFGSNLKEEYDAEREDRMIEHIIILIDNGML